MPGRILFGVAGWSYADWKDVVYPRNCKDTLRAVAARVELIEINSTFYGLPSAKNCTSWLQRTADFGTRFTAKLPEQITHHGRDDDAFLTEVRQGFAPLCASDRCLGLLAQFNYSHAFGEPMLTLLRRLAATFGQDTRLLVEVRHRSWNDPAAMAAMQELGISVAALDYPAMATGFSRDVPGASGRQGLAYYRLHGRNPAWFQKGAGRDQVYDWRYSATELAQIEARIERLAAATPHVAVVGNNHFRGSAVALIEDLLAWYHGRPPAPAAPG